MERKEGRGDGSATGAPARGCARARYRQWLAVVLTIAISGAALLPDTAPACTLWAAAGERTGDGGTLIAKNRDWMPEAQELRIARLRSGRRFLGLFPSRQGRRPHAVAGISEAGLAVVTATAGSVPRAEREKGEPGLAGRMLSEFSSVDDVLQSRELLSRSMPAIYLLADRRRIAWIEVAPRGGLAERVADSGFLCHTNHYLDEPLLSAHHRIGRSSARRLERIRELMGKAPVRMTPEDFMGFGRDTQAGPDDSIWRTGSRVGGERTLATWVVSLPRDGPPDLFVRMANPGEPEKLLRVLLDASFWIKEGGVSY